MPASTSNLTGLVSTNPFLNTQQKTGGTTTQASNYANFNPTPQIGATGLPGGLPTPTGTTSTTPSFNANGILPVPNSQNTSTGGTSGNANGSTSSGYTKNAQGIMVNAQGQVYGAAPGSTMQNGIVSLPQSGNVQPSATSPVSTNPANPTTKAPAGQEYGPTGLLQPIQGYSSSNPATFPGLVNQLGNTASAPTTQYTVAQDTAAKAATALASMGSTSTPEYQAALAQYNTANAALAKLRDQYATQSGNIAMTPGDLSLANGEQGALYNRFTGEQSALTGEMSAAQSAAQAATGQQIAQQTGLNEAGNVANTSAGAATGQQGTQQNGLGAAGQLAQPSYLAPGQSPYSPTSGQYGQLAGTQGGSGGLQEVGNISGQIGVGQNVAQLNSALGGAQVVGNNLKDLITQNNINPIGLTYANGALQFGAQAMSNPAYQKFAGQINDFIASLANILGAGGNITDMKTQMSSQIVNALQSGSTIKDVVSYFLSQAQQKIQGMSSGGGAGVGSAPTGGNTFGNFFGG